MRVPHVALLTAHMHPIGLSEATITTTWNSWGACIQISGSLDQNCRGTQTRTGITVDSEANTKTPRSQSQVCYLTYDIIDILLSYMKENKGKCSLQIIIISELDKIDGGYTTWGEWDDCSHKCNKRTTRRRTCHNPTPCNGGEDCSQFGRDTLTKDCGE
ncbi:unnamed protein product [Mytilus edulis]|uniref:Uncharacterized protein n=1 Tax=Mytilus edulis TaxID=6550 RepID=A0A8S3V2T3_MYTED|nr:unnamed protein product [Mytilus edulis]